jgi:hypothetical protein
MGTQLFNVIYLLELASTGEPAHGPAGKPEDKIEKNYF